MIFYFGIVLDLQKSYKDNTEFTYTANNSVNFFYTDIENFGVVNSACLPRVSTFAEKNPSFLLSYFLFHLLH